MAQPFELTQFNPAQDRSAIRNQIRALRHQLSPQQQTQAAKAAMAQMLTQLRALQPTKVGLYLTNDSELDTQPLFQALWRLNIDTYLPRLHPFNRGQLIFLHYRQGTRMFPNRYGIDEPKLDIRNLLPTEQLDLVITPLVAFDELGNRMGMGGGFYDRTLAHWQTAGKPLPIGYAHDCQAVPSLPCEHWDVPLAMIVTPSRVLRFGSETLAQG
ncbi:5-formyltetrahydrofolate cyclo-ligase [Shewanella salipaludis]|nr:5-formyltetrahydrofolate cyclo-ligase [Shewanella salipaludis]